MFANKITNWKVLKGGCVWKTDRGAALHQTAKVYNQILIVIIFKDGIYLSKNLILEITCAAPAAADDSGVIVSVTSSIVGAQAIYSCQEGRRLVGSPSRKCLVSGLWEGAQPDCECK